MKKAWSQSFYSKTVCAMVTRWAMIVFYAVVFLGGLGVAGVPSLIPAANSGDDPEEEPRLPLALEVSLKKPQPSLYEFHVHLTNVSAEPVSVDVHDLPWTPPNDSKWFKAFRLEGEHLPLIQTSFLGNFGSRSIRLLPGESVQDRIVLNHQIRSLLENIQQSGVLLQWDCPPSGIKFVCQKDAPHSVTIPKGDPGQPDVYIIDELLCQKLQDAIGLIRIPHDHDVLFLLTSETVMMDLTKAQALLYEVDDYVRHCQPRWTNSWAVSFFTEKKFAGFVSDLENQPYFEKGLWQQANIGQYASQIRTLFRFPWIRKKANSVYLSVYRPGRLN
ncbi:hypothetical protein [Candidatus Nitronereus thalassa]|uniref:AMIN domain-containing protein n=1 Tax=Candidatus Nitronereus thalassa TaxID=3020898 RepID=A0ABU3KCN7_9BACT|nr:hypothetical protein [Candidatus Nitronereus thalassa]MDT7044285.1 hypothetical protein [Candidatus Nitronereus thalassa]